MKRIHFIIFLVLLVIIAIETVHIFNLQKTIESLSHTDFSNVTSYTNSIVENVSTELSNSNTNTNSNIITYVTNTTPTPPAVPDETSKYYPEKVTITIKENTASSIGATIIIQDMNDENTTWWGEDYTLHYKHEGYWVELTPIKPLIFNAMAYHCTDHILEQKLDWKDSYGELSEGTYRIVKTKSIDGKDVQFVSNEFKLTKKN